MIFWKHCCVPQMYRFSGVEQLLFHLALADAGLAELELGHLAQRPTTEHVERIQVEAAFVAG